MFGPRKHSKTIHSHTTMFVPVTKYEAHLNVPIWQFNTVAFPRPLSGSKHEIAVPTVHLEVFEVITSASSINFGPQVRSFWQSVLPHLYCWVLKLQLLSRNCMQTAQAGIPWRILPGCGSPYSRRFLGGCYGRR